MNSLNTTPPGIPERDLVDRSVPTHVKVLGLIVLFMLGMAAGSILTMLAYQFGWIAQ